MCRTQMPEVVRRTMLDPTQAPTGPAHRYYLCAKDMQGHGPSSPGRCPRGLRAFHPTLVGRYSIQTTPCPLLLGHPQEWTQPAEKPHESAVMASSQARPGMATDGGLSRPAPQQHPSTPHWPHEYSIGPAFRRPDRSSMAEMS